jgi:hypothetical protein
MTQRKRKTLRIGAALLLYGILVALWAHAQAGELASRAVCCGLYGDYGLMHLPFPLILSSELSHWGGGPTRLNPWGLLLDLALPVGLVFFLNHPSRMVRAAVCRIRMGLSRQNRRVVRAWEKAGADLGIRVKPWHSFQTEEGKTCCALFWICDFGSPQGTLVPPITADMNRFFRRAQAAGYYASALNADSYSPYRRETFTDTLLDWGWCGDEDQMPDWMKGRENPWAGQER